MTETGKDRQPAPTDGDAPFSEASAWFFRLQAEDATAAERRAFDAWLARGPAEAAAWAELSGLMQDLKEPARAAHRTTQGLHRTPRPWSGLLRLRGLATAAALGLLLLVGGFGALRGPALYENLAADQVSGIGERLALPLPDGSSMELNSDTAVALEFGDGVRRVRLLRGEAWFQVVHDAAHPFTVEADGGAARVLGTQFGVRSTGGHATVTVGEGLVEVAPGGGGDYRWAEGVRLHPGDSVQAAARGLSPLQAADPGAVFAWRRGQMVFRQQPLSAVIDELNRHWPGRVVLLNGEAADRVVSGVFALDRPAAVFDALDRLIGVRAVRVTPYLTLLH